jgi:hypothetical protein
MDTLSHDAELERVLERGARSGMRYSRDYRGMTVFELVPEDDVL